MKEDNLLKVFLIKQSAAGYYNFEEVVESLPGNKQVQIGLFRGSHLPIYTFPKTEEELFSYDLVIIADVDPYVLTNQQARMLSDFVASGGGLLFTGGPHTFGYSNDFKESIADILPVRIIKEKDLIKVNSLPMVVDKDYITSGIPISRLGRVNRVHQLEVKEGCETILAASSYPLLIKGTFHKGRVIVLNSYQEIDTTNKDSFFISSFYDDLMRQAVIWLIKKEPQVRIKEFIPPNRSIPRGKTARLTLSLESPSLKDIKINYRIIKNKEIIKEEIKNINLSKQSRLTFTFQSSNDYKADGIYTIETLIRNERNEIIAKRDCQLEVIPSSFIKISFPYEKKCFSSLSKLEFNIFLSGDNLNNVKLDAQIFDFKNNLIKEFREKEIKTKKAEYLYTYTLPYLVEGEYKIISNLIDQKTKKIITRKEEKFYLVDRLNNDEFFSIAADLGIVYAGGQCPDEKWVMKKIDDLISCGFNTVSFWSCLDYCSPRFNRSNLINIAENYAQRKNMAIFYQCPHTNLYPGKKSYPCTFSPQYPEMIKRYFELKFKAGAKIPRLIAVAIRDEFTADEANLDWCQYCKEIFEERYGKLDQMSKLSLNMFIFDYISEGFKHLYEVNKKRKTPFKLFLNHIYTAYHKPRITDNFNWSRYADIIGTDIYPYYSGSKSQKIRMLYVHYPFSLLRNICYYLEKPLSFYVELSDRKYLAPPQASSECVYTGIGQGATFLPSFYNVAFGAAAVRPERWDYLGKELKKINSYTPLLKKVKKAEAKIATIFPFTQVFGTDKGYNYDPAYACHLFLRGFGEIDVLEERIAQKEGIAKYKGIVLLGTHWLNDNLSQMIIDFVKGGGVLILDNIPKFNENGEISKLSFLSAELSKWQKEIVVDNLELTQAKLGKGSILLFNFGLNKNAADKEVVDILLKFIHNKLFNLGLRPNVYSSNPEFEADLLKGDNTLLLLVINHNSTKDKTRVVLYQPEFIPEYVCDLATGKEMDYSVEEGNVIFNIGLEERDAVMIALYPEKSDAKEIKLSKRSFTRDDKLKYTIFFKDKEGSLVKGSYLLDIKVTDPDGRMINRYGGLHTTTKGIYGLTIPFSINDALGKWQIKVKDRYTGKVLEEEFNLLKGGKLVSEFSSIKEILVEKVYSGESVASLPSRIPEDKSTNVVYLNNLTPVALFQEWGEPMFDKNLTIGNTTFEKGIRTHAYSEIIYQIDGSYRYLEGFTGIASLEGSVIFQVYADGKKLYESESLYFDEEPKPNKFSVSVKGTKQIQLVVTNAGDRGHCDHANWADIKLRK